MADGSEQGIRFYFVCTGLYENIQELSNVKNLTFFRRAATVKTEPLNMIRMTEMYKSKLDIDSNEAREMAKITKDTHMHFRNWECCILRKSWMSC